MQDAGAAAIEPNIYYLPGNPPPPTHLPSPFPFPLSGRDAEQRYVDILTTVKAVVSIPVAVKLNPYFSSLAEMAVRLDRAGADGLVLFNRFMQTDINPRTLTMSTGSSFPARPRPRSPDPGSRGCGAICTPVWPPAPAPGPTRPGAIDDP
jgi:dihydroorotate dehydrogenase (fumarate)